MLLVPFERYFRERGVGISAVVNGLDNEFHPLCPHGPDINLLTVHAVSERQLARTTVRELCGDGFEAIILCPNLRALEVAGLNQNAMEIDLSIEIETNPLAESRSVCSFDPSGAALSVDRVRGIISIALHCQTN